MSVVMRACAFVLAAAAAAAVLAFPPRNAAPVGLPSVVVIEHRGVRLGHGVEVALGTAVDRLPDGLSLAAYDAAARSGLVQYRVGTDGPVVLAVVDGRVGAISVGWRHGYRTAAGVRVGDDAGRIRATYADAVGGDPGYVSLAAGGAVTAFDTRCTGRVNAIGVASGEAGMRLLSDLWSDAGC